jgi:hypothetical protein
VQPYATRIKWTLWGGMLGPRMFNHVKCVNCGTKYNGTTGQSNDTKIAIYLAVSLIAGLILGGLVLVLPFLAG